MGRSGYEFDKIDLSDGEYPEESSYWYAVDCERTVLAVTRSVNTTLALIDGLPDLLHDRRVQVLFTVMPKQRDANFERWMRRLVTEAGVREISWEEAVGKRFDLVVTASYEGALNELSGHMLILNHGTGVGKYLALPPDGRLPVLAQRLQLRDLRRRGHVVEEDQELAVHGQGPEPFRPFLQRGRNYRADRREPADEVREDATHVDRRSTPSLREVGHQVASVKTLADQMHPLLPQCALSRPWQTTEDGDERALSSFHPLQHLVELAQLFVAVDELLRLLECGPRDHASLFDGVPLSDMPLEEVEAERRHGRDHCNRGEPDPHSEWTMDRLGKAGDGGGHRGDPGAHVPVRHQLIWLEVLERHPDQRLVRTYANLGRCPLLLREARPRGVSVGERWAVTCGNLPVRPRHTPGRR